LAGVAVKVAVAPAHKVLVGVEMETAAVAVELTIRVMALEVAVDVVTQDKELVSTTVTTSLLLKLEAV
jgi:hypothetical protein